LYYKLILFIACGRPEYWSLQTLAACGDAFTAVDPIVRNPSFSPKLAKGRSVTRAFRFSIELERQLINEAATEKISANRLVTRMLEDHLAAGAVRKKLGWMELPQMLWADLIKQTPEDKRVQIARRRGVELTKQILINLYGHAAADTFLRFLPGLGNFLTSAYVEVSANREDYTILVVHAGAGIGLAKFISTMILASVEYFLHVKTITEYSENACAIKFKTKLNHDSRLATHSASQSDRDICVRYAQGRLLRV